jgi:hypothetical protein
MSVYTPDIITVIVNEKINPQRTYEYTYVILENHTIIMIMSRWTITNALRRGFEESIS